MARRYRLGFCGTMAVLSAAAGVLTTAATAQPTSITEVPGLPGATSTTVAAVSADGSVVTGRSAVPTLTGPRGFRWVVGGATTNLGLPSSPSSFPNVSPRDISADGLTIVGQTATSSGERAFRWTTAQGLTLLPTPGGTSFAGAGAVSANGLTAAGQTTAPYSVWRWTQAGGSVSLRSFDTVNPFAPPVPTVTDMSNDGSVVVGTVGVYSFPGPGEIPSRTLFRWSTAAGLQVLAQPTITPGFPFSPIPGEVTQAWCTSDGSTVIGAAEFGGYSDIPGSTRTFRWTPTGGFQIYPVPPELPLSVSNPRAGVTVTALSRDGAFIAGGFIAVSNLVTPVVSTDGITWTPLSAILENLGVDLAGWTLTSITGISDDKRTLIGNGTRNGQSRAWIVRNFPGPCMPRIIAQPVSGAPSPGEPFTLAVTAASDQGGTLSYQWRKDGVRIPSATSSTLAFSSFSAADAGAYDVVVRNSCGTAVSQTAIVSRAATSVRYLAATDITANSATIRWTIDRPATARVAFGSSRSALTGLTAASPSSTSGSRVITGTPPGLYYQLVVVDSGGVETRSDIREVLFRPSATGVVIAATVTQPRWSLPVPSCLGGPETRTLEFRLNLFNQGSPVTTASVLGELLSPASASSFALNPPNVNSCLLEGGFTVNFSGVNPSSTHFFRDASNAFPPGVSRGLLRLVVNATPSAGGSVRRDLSVFVPIPQ